MSLRERDRIAVLRAVEDGLLRPVEGAGRLGLSCRQFRRLRRRAEQEGDAAAIHRLRGRPSNHRADEALKSIALARAREPVFHDFGPTLLAEHLSQDPRICHLCPATLRKWLIAEGLWVVSPRKLRHRSRRDRKAAFGELVQMDTSIHNWLEGRPEREPVLIAMIDDATSRLFARFAESDSGHANRATLKSYIEQFGRMGAIYVDRACHFQRQSAQRQLADKRPMSSTIKRALDSLDIQLITALSPQAKGRVERSFKTLQDRLLKEMRVASISTIESANDFLEKTFLPFWNTRYAIKPRVIVDFHRPTPPDTDLMEIFAEAEQRLIRRDFTIRYQNVYYQVPETRAVASMPGTQLQVLRRLDGKLSFRWRQSCIDLVELKGLPESEQKPERGAGVCVRRSPSPKQINHPWRRSNFLFAVKD